MLTSLKSWVRPDRFHAVLVRCLGERSVRWYNACLRITRDADLAADAVQEALLKAWDRRDEFRGESELDTWIHRIALNAAIDLMRRRRPQAAEASLDTEYLIAANSPHGEYVQEALSRDLITAMQRLTTMERQTFVLKHIEGWRLEEIAETLQTNANNTKQALFRAVRKLRVDLHVWRGES